MTQLNVVSRLRGCGGSWRTGV